MRISRPITLVAALVLVACGESTAPLNVTPAQLESIGQAVATEIEGGVKQLTVQDVMSTNGGAPAFMRMPALSGLSLNRLRAGESALRAEVCGVPSQNPPTDSDGDQIPDNLSISFLLPACHYADQTSSIDITGVLHVSDPQPGTAGMALNFGLQKFKIAFGSPQGSGSIVRDGNASVSASQTGLSQMVDWTESLVFSGSPNIGVDVNWTATFAAAQGQVIGVGSPLPSGTFTANGTVNYREGKREASFSVTTITALQYSAACAADVENGLAFSPFTAGKVRVLVTSQEGSAYVEVTYAGCNEASVTVVGG